MKIIDLLNKIANGEDVPKKIRLVTPVLKNQVTLIYNEEYKVYFDEEYNPLSHHLSDNLANLNDEIVVIEDKIDIQNIEELNEWVTRRNGEVTQTEAKILEIGNKQNELIKALKQLDNKINHI